MKKRILTIVILILLFSCKDKMKNPLMNFVIGEDEEVWKTKIEENIKNGNLSNQYKDLYIYRYYFTKGKKKIFSDVYFNSDGYDYGKLRIIKFELNGDTTYIDGIPRYHRTSGPRKIETVDTVLNWLIELYGPPTDTFNLHKRVGNVIRLNEETNYQRVFNINPSEGSLIWEMNNYNIEFSKTLEYKLSSDTTPAKYYATSYLIYKIKDYEKELKLVTEPIRLTLKPKDLIKIDVLQNPKWKKISLKNSYSQNYEFSINFPLISRIGKEETRNISDVQFDLIITDVFEKEIYKFKDIKVHFPKPLQLFEGYMHYYYNFEYNTNWESTFGLEKARKIKENGGKLNCFAVPNAIVFEDGTVLK